MILGEISKDIGECLKSTMQVANSLTRLIELKKSIDGGSGQLMGKANVELHKANTELNKLGRLISDVYNKAIKELEEQGTQPGQMKITDLWYATTRQECVAEQEAELTKLRDLLSECVDGLSNAGDTLYMVEEALSELDEKVTAEQRRVSVLEEKVKDEYERLDHYVKTGAKGWEKK